MRIELPKNVERFGAVRFGDLQKVFELDAGISNGRVPEPVQGIHQVSYRQLCDIYEDMAVVVPTFNEKLKLVEGVLSAIPHPCMIIVVSNSPREPVDRFHMDQDALRDFCTFAGKNGVIVHQKDPLFAKAFQNAEYSAILDKEGVVRDGKAEGMIIATVLARLAGKKYVGFVDADNYFPGSVEEYVREYAAGFTLSRSRFAMVRISWQSKPKIIESKLFFRKWGRTSQKTNALLNRLIAYYSGFETDIIKTGNAGEHALTMDLAMILDYASGYCIEPFHIINMLEKFGGIQPSPLPEVMHETVEMWQIESRNPHLHDAGDKSHIDTMSYNAMQVIYHSPVTPDFLKKEIRREAVARKFQKPGKPPDKPHYFPPLFSIDLDRFAADIESAPFAKPLLTPAGIATG
ncbi:MAG: mannosyl-3-phosphoglycerate synthase [Fidelibacterota bacterium]